MSEDDLSPSLLAGLVSSDEGRTLDFKEAWPDLGTAQGRAELAKDVLAFANTVERGERAYIVIGVQDRKHGGAVLGVSSAPSAEQVSQILADYTVPPPRSSVRTVTHNGKALSVVTIVGIEARPHHAVRHHTGVLNPSIVYVRRDSTTGAATSQEVEAMIRAKLGRPGYPIDQAPIKVGFVGQGDTLASKTLIVRITNVTEAAVAGIDALIDLQHIGLPQLAARQRFLSNLTLESGQTREFEAPIRAFNFVVRNVEMSSPATIRVVGANAFNSKVGDGWLNAYLRVYYRDDDGFLHEITREIALDV